MPRDKLFVRVGIIVLRFVADNVPVVIVVLGRLVVVIASGCLRGDNCGCA
ncbi:hypothetical protein AG1IA_08584 [Rhizoctonia solani AG-1 IA]|uniref:Uncharacterized protein n=1 Tax=Thanatephorus cucumeris (strain AG1-IA) TaxID=983506 RepID=L8WGT2_THACA|nr:hypothetical protein AG1IA_08584 [Rhizoctonia solani AG-1 IA]